MSEIWKKCSSCKTNIMTGQKYFVCSVSTCQGRTTNYTFCGVPCWEAHLPIERHRADSAGALERTAPRDLSGAEPPRKVVVPGSPSPVKSAGAAKPLDDGEILVVVSKVRKYISDTSGMNTSGDVYEILTKQIKSLCDRGIEVARTQGRKTVMARDF